MAASGDTVVVGAPFGAPFGNTHEGSAYVFQLLSPEQQIELLIGEVEELVTNTTLKTGQGGGGSAFRSAFR